MGYDVHITRAENWLASKHHPILESEWMAFVQTDPTLKIDTLSYSNRQTRDGIIERQHPVMWVGHPDQAIDDPNFWHDDGRIYRKNPDDPTLRKMIEIAQKLGARVVGDDEEEYDEIDGKIRVRPWGDFQ